MSATMITLSFTITVSDSDHWDKDHLQACHNDDTAGSYAEWVEEQLDAVIRKAANQFINENDDLFQTKEIT